MILRTDYNNNNKKKILRTFKSLKNTEFRAQSTCENRFWSSTLHMSSKRSTSHWLYVWFCNRPNSELCHSRSSSPCTKSRIIGDMPLTPLPPPLAVAAADELPPPSTTICCCCCCCCGT